jgi:hypothetical protein
VPEFLREKQGDKYPQSKQDWENGKFLACFQGKEEYSQKQPQSKDPDPSLCKERRNWDAFEVQFLLDPGNRAQYCVYRADPTTVNSAKDKGSQNREKEYGHPKLDFLFCQQEDEGSKKQDLYDPLQGFLHYTDSL